MTLLLAASLLGAAPAWAGVPRTPRDKCNADADVDRLGSGKQDDLHSCFANVPHPGRPHIHAAAHHPHHAHHR